MAMPTDMPIFEVRATLTNGVRRRLGLYANEGDAAEQAALLLAMGGARRVETIRRVNGQIELVAVAGKGPRVGARRPVDRL